MLNGLIENFVCGDDLDIERTVTGIPSGQTLTQALLTIRTFEAGGAAVLTKTITPTISDNGLVTNGDTTATLVFTLSDTDTDTLSPGNYHYYWIDVITSAGKEYTAEKGRIKGEIGN